MPTIFEPDMETPEGWRATPLGMLACGLGWHFGQVVRGGPPMVQCARCKKLYTSHWTLGYLDSKAPYLLPYRSIIILKWRDEGEVNLRDDFLAYACLDCNYKTKDAQDILNHQRKWHNWRTWWRRIKAS